MRVVVLCSEPDAAERDAESIPTILRDLGCSVTVGRFDVAVLEEAELGKSAWRAGVIDAGDERERASRCLRKLGSYGPLAEAPTLLALAVHRLSGLDFSIGVSDFILK